MKRPPKLNLKAEDDFDKYNWHDDGTRRDIPGERTMEMYKQALLKNVLRRARVLPSKIGDEYESHGEFCFHIADTLAQLNKGMLNCDSCEPPYEYWVSFRDSRSYERRDDLGLHRWEEMK